jgi:hypothetical protein
VPNHPSLHIPPEQEDVLRRAVALYPHPIAMACGRVLRARSAQERLDLVLRAGEILARYLALVGIASYAARPRDPDPAETPPETSGPLAFGHFVKMAQFAARSHAEHPLVAELLAGFRGKDGGEGPTGDALLALLQLRNELGHSLDGVTEVRAAGILAEHDPILLLVEALRGVRRLLGFPLLVVEEQRMADEGVVVARLLYLMGESADPEPREMAITGAFGKNRVPYLGSPNGLLRLHPLLVWAVAEAQHNYGLFILDTVEADRVIYKPVSARSLERTDETVAQVAAVVGGTSVPLEIVTQREGAPILDHWRAEADRRRAAAEHREGHVPWGDLDAGTIEWYASRLDPEAGPDDPRKVVEARLLDGREQFRPEEIAQLVLLFGQDANVRARIGREMIDLRVTGTPGARWTERLESHGNVLSSLRLAVEFLARHVGVEGVTIDGLRSTSGSADYVALREALINLFIHQDYGDSSAAAQVEVAPERTVFFNTGKSLVSTTSLLEGGKSQARNPLIARALRLIGFAELAGSGLRELQRVWRGAERRPPRMESSSAANTFTLTLDWRPVPDAYDRFWKDRIGARVNETQATILNLALDPSGVSPEEAASATGLELTAAQEALSYLKIQVLVEQRKGRYHISPHLQDLVEAEEGGGSSTGDAG